MTPQRAIDAYTQRVVDDLLPAGKYHRLACVRHLRDRAREGTPAFPYVFDLDRAERFFRFAAALKHYKGRQWAGKPIVLTDCQRFRLGSLFGWIHIETGIRRFRSHYNELPRKQGKSLEAAIVLLYLTFFDGEAGAEGYITATKLAQSKIVFKDAKQLVKANPGLSRRISVHAWNLHQVRTASKVEPLSADHEGLDGLNPQVVVVDEFHAVKDRGIIDVLEGAMGARLQPVNFQITTAGNDPVSPCGDQHDYACKILDGILDDETFYAFIAHADEGDDPFDERTWQKANPHYGISVNPADMRALATKARNMPAAAAAFKQKRLNIWTNAIAPWLSMEGWQQGQSTGADRWDPLSLKGESCWVGVDLASTIDLCAMVFVFPPTATRAKTRLLRWVWTPQETLVMRARRDRAPYPVWAEQTWSGQTYLIAVPGVRVNHRVIRDVLVEQRQHFQIEQVGFDPWHADQVMDDLIELDGFGKEQVILVSQTYKDMSKPSLDYEAAVLEGVVDANDCPLMRWCHSNVVVQRDGKDNVYPVKKKSRGRIDPVMATIIGWKLATLGKKTKRKKGGRASVWDPVRGFVPAGGEPPVSSTDVGAHP